MIRSERRRAVKYQLKISAAETFYRVRVTTHPLCALIDPPTLDLSGNVTPLQSCVALASLHAVWPWRRGQSASESDNVARQFLGMTVSPVSKRPLGLQD